MYKSETNKMLLKEMFWRLIEEVFSPNNKKELMRRLDEVIDGVMHENKLAKEAMGASNRGGNEAERQQMKRKEKMPGAFWEEDMVKSMHLMDRDRAVSQEDEIVPPMLLEASVQPFKLVGPD